MSNTMMARVWNTVDLTQLSDAEGKLLLAYADIANDDGDGIWASDEYTHWKTGVALRTIQASKKKWRESGVLCSTGFYHIASGKIFVADVSIERGSGGRGWAAIYRLCLDPLARKEPWKKLKPVKVAVDATFNPGRPIQNGHSSGEEKVAVDATFTGEKVAKSDTEGRKPEQEKVAKSDTEGRKIDQRNKEELLVETQEGTVSGKRPGLSQGERDSWDLRRWQDAMRESEPPVGSQAYYLQGDEAEAHWRKRARTAAYQAGIAPTRLVELLKQHFPNDPNIDLLYDEPLFAGKETA